MSRRATTIFGQPGPLKPAAAPKTDAEEPPMAGNWSRLAYRGMETKLQEMTADAELMRNDQLERILAGTIPVAIATDDIVDLVGTDRVASVDDDPTEASSYTALVNNIQERGLRTPIRVRPVDPLWRPNTTNPFDTAGVEFTLQSGRRRLAACRQLNIPVLAFISFPDDEGSKLEDLQERYFENVARRDLTQAEKMISIALIAENLPELMQSELGEMLHVDQAMVSRSLNLYKNLDDIAKIVDLPTASYREITAAMKVVKQPSDGSAAPDKAPIGTASIAPLPFSTRQIGESKVALKAARSGARTLTISSKELDDDLVQKVIDLLEENAKP